MKSATEKKISISCTGCNSSYSVPLYSDTTEKTLKCTTCGKNLKIIKCSQCQSHYSITYSSLKQDKYRFTCQKCNFTFIINFNEQEIQKENNTKTIQLNISQQKKKKKPFIEKKIIPKENKKKAAKQDNSNIDTAGRTIETFSIHEIFYVCGQAFSKTKLLIAAMGTAILLSLLFIYNSIITTINGSSFFYSIIFSSFMALFLYVYTMTASLISKSTISTILLNRGNTKREMTTFMFKISIPLLFSNGFLLLILNGLLLIFGKIPFLGPMAFGLLFLPVYLLSVILIALLFIGFWFYPPILAHRMTGVKENVSNLYHFIKKHNLTLVYIIPILLITASLSFGLIYLLHLGAFKISIFTAGLVMGQDAERIFSSIPGPFSKISSLSLFGSDLSLFKGLFLDVTGSIKAGGFILGVTLMAITLLLFSFAISIVSTLSTHMYIFMERGIESKDKAIFQVLAILILILLSVLLFQKVFF